MKTQSSASTAPALTAAQLHVLAPITDWDEPGEESQEEHDEQGQKESCADTLLRIGMEAKFIHTALGEPFARTPVTSGGGTHYELHPVREKGSGFRRWLVSRYFEETRQTPNTSALTRVMELFAAWADQDSPEEVYTRLAEHDGAIYLDLANDQWQVVKITPDGWKVVSECPVYFRRAKGMLPIPTPTHGGSLSELRDFFNVASEDDWKMVVGWLLGVFHPDGPYAILAISGDQGTAKTSATRFLRQLVDPNMAPLRDAPEDKRDLVIAAKNGRVLALDNLSSMPQWLSDALCRMATGSGYATRALYTDDDEALFNSRRPIVFNGIEELATRPDLGERCLVLTLQEIDRRQRKTERELNAAWEKAQPRILGSLLDAVSCALAERDHVHFAELPRMADFVEWVTAAERQLGWKKGTFAAVLDRNRESAIQTELEASPVADALLQLMESRTVWKGTPKELHGALTNIATDRVKALPEWPKNPQKLSGKLRRLAPALRANGIAVTLGASHGQRYIELRHTGNDSGCRTGDATSGSGDATDRNFSSLASPDDAGNGPENGPRVTQVTQQNPLILHGTQEGKREEECVVEEPGKVASLASLPGDQGSGHSASLFTQPQPEPRPKSDDRLRCPKCGAIARRRYDGIPGIACSSCGALTAA